MLCILQQNFVSAITFTKTVEKTVQQLSLCIHVLTASHTYSRGKIHKHEQQWALCTCFHYK